MPLKRNTLEQTCKEMRLQAFETMEVGYLA